MTQENTQAKKDEELTGSDVPEGDGRVSDEDVQAINDENEDRPTGQDHSTELHERQMPESGVGAIQDNSTLKGFVADIDDEE